MIRFVTAAALVCLVAPTFAASPTPTQDHISQLEAGIVPAVLVRDEAPTMPSLSKRMADLGVPGISVAVIHKGQIEWAKGYGVTRVGGPPVTADTLFQAASISKPVFALAVLHLVDEGKLKLDANVNDYLKTWKVPDNEFTTNKKVTLRGILSHSAGLTVHGFPGYAKGAALPTTVQMLDGTAPASNPAIRVDVIPGTRYRYSGGGYVVAQQLLGDVTGVPLPRFMRDTVLAPLGMTLSTFEQPLPATRSNEVAMPYEDKQMVFGGPHTYPEMAPAGLWTTPSDLARYALGVQAALKGESKIISAATARAMLTPVLENHGVGPVVGGSTARKFFTHGGSNAGYRCLLVAYEDGEGAIVMTNSDSGGQLMGEVMRTLAHIYQWPDFAPVTRTLANVTPKVLDRLIGAYEMNDGSIYAVYRDNGRLVGHMIDRAPAALFPSSDRELFAKDADVVASFTLNEDGAVTAVKHRVNGFERNGPRANEAKSHAVITFVTESAQRLKNQQPHPASESAIRALLSDLAHGTPNYERMTPRFADITREQLPVLKTSVLQMGTLKSLKFVRAVRVGADRDVPGGGDDFDAVFENDSVRIFVRLGFDGRIEAAGLRKLPWSSPR